MFSRSRKSRLVCKLSGWFQIAFHFLNILDECRLKKMMKISSWRLPVRSASGSFTNLLCLLATFLKKKRNLKFEVLCNISNTQISMYIAVDCFLHFDDSQAAQCTIICMCYIRITFFSIASTQIRTHCNRMTRTYV